MVSQSILVVDDDTDIAERLSRLLRAHGYEVFTAFDGVQGYRQYFNHPTDVVVTDIQMPEMDGVAMMRCIRAINPRVKTVYVSGDLERFDKDVKSEEQQFAVVSVLKPIKTEALLKLMSAQVGDGPTLQSSKH